MTSKHKRHARIAPILGVAVILAGIAVSPAAAANQQAAPAALAEEKTDTPAGAPGERPPGGFATWEELIATQTRLNSAATHILTSPSSDQGAAASTAGHAGTVVAPESREVVLYWQGAVPADVQVRARETGVPVKFVPAQYTSADLANETQRLSTDKRVLSVSPNVDGSGITVSVGNDADAAAIRAEVRVRAIVEIGPGPSLLWDRQNDISPYWGGARFDNLTIGGYCSTGFTVNFFGQRKMLTAGHCGNNGHVVRIGNIGQPNTTLGLDVDPRDTVMINKPAPVASNFDGRIYTGGIYSMSSRDVIVAPAIDFPGNWICTGGARTGEHCNAQVTLVDTAVLGRYPMTRADAAVNTCIAAPGDSGGPVYSLSGAFNAQGRGTITAGILNTPCLADSGSRVPPPIITNGSRTVWYAPLQRGMWSGTIGSLQFYSATLI